MDWIPVSERLPAEPSADVVFESIAYIVTDGDWVGFCHFERGHGCGEPWAEWDDDDVVITHWMPFPKPPEKS